MQDYSNIEYIVIDGGSSDGTNKIIENACGNVACFVSEPDLGIYDAMNKGVSLATGDVICFLNSDDFYPNSSVVSRIVEIFLLNPSLDSVLGNVDFVRPNNLDNPVRLYSSFFFSPWLMRFGLMPAHPAAFFRSQAFNKVGLFRLSYKIGADFEWLVRAFVVYRLTYTKVDEIFVRMRTGGVSTSGFKSYWTLSKENLNSLKLNGIYSNYFFVFLRLPFKFFYNLFR